MPILLDKAAVHLRIGEQAHVSVLRFGCLNSDDVVKFNKMAQYRRIGKRTGFNK